MSSDRPIVSVLRGTKDAESFAAGTVVFRAGDAGDCLFVVQEGEVDLAVHGQVVEVVGPGGVFGEMALIDAAPRSATATTCGDTRLVRVDQRRFRFLVEQHPYFAIEVMRVMAHRLRRMDDRLLPPA